MRSLILICLSFFAVQSYAGHPASDAVANFFDEAVRIQQGPASSRAARICRLVGSATEHRQIATRLLGKYANSADKNGVSDFQRSSASILVSKAMPEIEKAINKQGSFVVDPQASDRGNGYYAVAVRITTDGKTYNGRAIVSPNMKVSDVEYLGFSGVNYATRKMEQEIAKFNSSKTPVAAYLKDLRSQPGYVKCN